MPIYSFLCKTCEHAWEDLRNIGDDFPGACPDCESPDTRKQLSLGSFILKGGGWANEGYSKYKPKK